MLHSMASKGCTSTAHLSPNPGSNSHLDPKPAGPPRPTQVAGARCPSDEEHDPKTIKDHVIHYISCLKIKERRDFWSEEHPVWEAQLKAQIKKLENVEKAQAKALKAKAAAEKRQAESDLAALEEKRTSGGAQGVTGEGLAKGDGTLENTIKDIENRIARATSDLAKANTSRKSERQIEEEAKIRVGIKIGATAYGVRSLYRRARIIRDAIKSEEQATGADASTPKNPGIKGKDEGQQEKSVVGCLEESREWITDFRRSKGQHTTVDADDEEAVRAAASRHGIHPSNTSGGGYYDVDKDINAYFMQFRRSTDSTRDSVYCADYVPPDCNTAKEGPQAEQQKAAFKQLESCKVTGTFPDQKVSMYDLLNHEHVGDEEADCILSSGPAAGRVKYIHIPANNMDYVEKVIPKYYGEERPELDDGPFSDPLEQSRSYMLLRPQFWRGQQHGSHTGSLDSLGLPVHARHLRPMCQTISSDPPYPSGRKDDSLAIFMPFLHWEYDRQRLKIARIIDEESHCRREQNAEMELAARARRIKEWEEKYPPKPPKPQDDSKKVGSKSSTFLKHFSCFTAEPTSGTAEQSQQDKTNTPHRQDTFTSLAGVANAVGRKHEPLTTTAGGRMLVKGKRIGQYLVDAARLYESIYLFRDRKMLQKYLFMDGEAPLHPRRTLDQSYYWTLRTTKDLDRDQVVYRGTNMDIRLAHRLTRDQHKRSNKQLSHLVKEKMEGVLRLASQLSPKGHGGDSANGGRLPVSSDEARVRQPKATTKSNHNEVEWKLCGKVGDHTTGNAKDDKHAKSCEQCRGDIRKISRVVMVDQLWMWILDKHTIITCFPRRYGMNKQDPSGVFKAIRMRLQGSTIELRSVFDIALVILRECTNTLLDGSQPQDQRPQVMDIFAEAIGKIDHKLSIQFERLWNWTETASKVYRAKYSNIEAVEFYASLLDINPEGKLQKEIRDIIDELNIMVSIKKKQKELILRFIQCAKRFLDDTSEHDRPWRPSTRYEDGSGAASAATDPVKHKELEGFELLASELESEIDNRIGELESLKQSAQSTAQDVTDLLVLKQQQAGVVQAWQSVKQGEETVRQSRSIMMFTVVTIFFLPLSFMSSVFGMNNSTFTGDDNSMSLGVQMAIMFPISTFIIFLAVWIAFSRFFRTFFWAFYTVGTTKIMVTLPFYRLRLEHIENWSSNKLTAWAENKIARLKDKVEKDVHVRARAKWREDEERREAEAALEGKVNQEHTPQEPNPRSRWKGRRGPRKLQNGDAVQLNAITTAKTPPGPDIPAASGDQPPNSASH